MNFRKGCLCKFAGSIYTELPIPVMTNCFGVGKGSKCIGWVDPGQIMIFMEFSQDRQWARLIVGELIGWCESNNLILLEIMPDSL